MLREDLPGGASDPCPAREDERNITALAGNMEVLDLLAYRRRREFAWRREVAAEVKIIFAEARRMGAGRATR